MFYLFFTRRSLGVKWLKNDFAINYKNLNDNATKKHCIGRFTVVTNLTFELTPWLCWKVNVKVTQILKAYTCILGHM